MVSGRAIKSGPRRSIKARFLPLKGRSPCARIVFAWRTAYRIWGCAQGRKRPSWLLFSLRFEDRHARVPVVFPRFTRKSQLSALRPPTLRPFGPSWLLFSLRFEVRSARAIFLFGDAAQRLAYAKPKLALRANCSYSAHSLLFRVPAQRRKCHVKPPFVTKMRLFCVLSTKTYLVGQKGMVF